MRPTEPKEILEKWMPSAREEAALEGLGFPDERIRSEFELLESTLRPIAEEIAYSEMELPKISRLRRSSRTILRAKITGLSDDLERRKSALIEIVVSVIAFQQVPCDLTLGHLSRALDAAAELRQ